MSTWRRALAATCGALAVLAAPAAWGQTMYRCNEGGSIRWSDRPCPADGRTNISSYGPARETQRPSASQARVSKAPEHLPYLGPVCAQLSDAIRTAPARGVGYATQSELRDEYRRKCSEEERDAMDRVSRERRDQRQQERDSKQARQQEQAQAAAEREQCAEMNRILGERRKRLDGMSPGERADLQRFETNYLARCKG